MKKGQNIALEFNDFSKNYTNDMIGCVPYYLQQVAGFVNYLPSKFYPKAILDLGCGNGNITAQLIRHCPNATYTLVDASADMINLCRTQFSDYNIIYCNKYFKDFLFNADSYDLIVAGFSLHHCDDIEKQVIFKHLNSSLRKGGIFSYSDLMITKTNPDHAILLGEWKKFVNNNFRDGDKWTWLMEHYDSYDKPTDYLVQIEWLKNAGFNTIRIPFKKGYWVHLQALK